ncbi:MAG: hypothetical protein ACP5K1_01290, partial [Candidatus Bathyarchaeia archaeon]
RRGPYQLTKCYKENIRTNEKPCEKSRFTKLMIGFTEPHPIISTGTHHQEKRLEDHLEISADDSRLC